MRLERRTAPVLWGAVGDLRHAHISNRESGGEPFPGFRRGRWRVAPDGVWAEALTLKDCTAVAAFLSRATPCFPHPIRPFGPPSPAKLGKGVRPGRNRRLAQSSANSLDDDRQSPDDEFVGKSENTESRASKPRVPLGVPDPRIRRLVRAAVRLDDDLA